MLNNIFVKKVFSVEIDIVVLPTDKYKYI